MCFSLLFLEIGFIVFIIFAQLLAISIAGVNLSL